jgi:cbb3-type cytochrome c oxidase subunit III
MQQKGGKAIVQYRAIECCFHIPSLPQANKYLAQVVAALPKFSLAFSLLYRLQGACMNQKSFLKSLSVALLAISALASVSYAAEEKAVAAKADPVKGEALYTNGDATRNIIACISCHGAAGNSTISQNPKLAGQHAAYLVKQLTNFTEPSRNNAVMTTMAKALSPADIQNVTAYLSTQTTKPGAAKNKDLIDLGKKIYRGGIGSINVPACASCHGPNGSGIPNLFPRLAAQHQDYTVAQLTNFRTGTRTNSPEMKTIASRMSDEEIKAVADYVAGLK